MIAMISSKVRQAGLALGMFAAMAAMAAPAKSDTVFFNTLGSSFTGGGNGTVDPLNNDTIVFADGSGRSVTLSFNEINTSINTPSGSDLGSFIITTQGFTNTTQRLNVGTGSSFNLVVNQTSPSVGSLNFIADITGSIGINSGSLFLTFRTPTDGMIGTVEYELVNLTFGSRTIPNRTFVLDNGATGGLSRPTAFITANAIPEPASIAMLGLGGASLVGFARRRKAKLA